jgi:uncharacterized protein
MAQWQLSGPTSKDSPVNCRRSMISASSHLNDCWIQKPAGRPIHITRPKRILWSGAIALAIELQCNYTWPMSSLQFEWDERKAVANVKKHGVSFEEAKSAFYDERARLIDDPDHSEDEDRFVLLGLSSALRLLVVCHCYRGDGGVIRIISARKATTKEMKFYM